jgi:hypothetical protein
MPSVSPVSSNVTAGGLALNWEKSKNRDQAARKGNAEKFAESHQCQAKMSFLQSLYKKSSAL